MLQKRAQEHTQISRGIQADKVRHVLLNLLCTTSNSQGTSCFVNSVRSVPEAGASHVTVHITYSGWGSHPVVYSCQFTG